MSALNKVMCHEVDKTVLAFGNVFSTVSLTQLTKASLTCLGRNCLGQLILHGTKKARPINTSSCDVNWNLYIFRVSVREHLPNPLYRVIHKSLRDFRTRLCNNQDRHGRKEHINRYRISPSFFCTRGLGVLQVPPLGGTKILERFSTC